MNKKGFTLIELLTVIVVLAIIALIATPIVMNMISKVEKSAAERSADNYLHAVDLMISAVQLDGVIVSDGVYIVDNDGNITGNGKTYTVEANGDIPKAGSTIAIANEEIVAEGTSITVGNYVVMMNSSNEFVAYDPICTLESGEEYAVGSKYTCNPGDGEKTFYILEVSGNTATLLMDRNIDNSRYAWCSSGSVNTCNASGAIAVLNSKTTKWTNPQIISIGLPTYNQIYNVNKSTSFVSKKWLYDHLDSDSSTSIQSSYWTGTANPNYDNLAWTVTYNGSFSNDYVNYERTGVRAVITVSKAHI